jgi:pimeloyl-ACP methyl ester carboxylesterase
LTRERACDPFDGLRGVPVAGGLLAVASAGPPASEADAVVLAVHGVASSHAVWRTVARELNGIGGSRTCLIAPDLRGRARSAGLPGPYGQAAHVADMLAVLDDAGAGPVVLLGHSMGGYVACALAARHPDRVSAVVLVDGGVAMPVYPSDIADALVEPMVDSALELPRLPFASVEEHVAQWRAHPAFARDWNEDVDDYARYGLKGEPGALHVAISEAAVRADVSEMAHDEASMRVVDGVRAPIQLLRASRGMRDDAPMVPRYLLETFVGTHPHAQVEEVHDANHYTIVIGAGPGPVRVAAAVEAAIGDHASSTAR